MKVQALYSLFLKSYSGQFIITDNRFPLKDKEFFEELENEFDKVANKKLKEYLKRNEKEAEVKVGFKDYDKKLIKTIKDVLDILDIDIDNNFKLESKLRDDLGLDSLDEVELVMHIEEKFDIEIPDQDAEKIFTIKECLDYLKGRLKNEK